MCIICVLYWSPVAVRAAGKLAYFAKFSKSEVFGRNLVGQPQAFVLSTPDM